MSAPPCPGSCNHFSVETGICLSGLDLSRLPRLSRLRESDLTVAPQCLRPGWGRAGTFVFLQDGPSTLWLLGPVTQAYGYQLFKASPRKLHANSQIKMTTLS